MNIKQSVFAQLSGAPVVTALVGDRIYPLVLPTGVALPAITYMQVSGASLRTLGGADASPRRVRFQLSCLAPTYQAATELAAAVRSVFQDFQGELGGPGGVHVIDSDVPDSPDLYDDEVSTCHIPVDVLMTIRGGGP